MKAKPTRLTNIVLLVFSLFFLLSGCGQGGQRIAFFQYKSGDTFISEMMEHMTSGVPEERAF